MKTLKRLLSNQSGIALMMVLSAIVILTAIMTDFAFETHINKLKGYNIEDKGQARLTAESGLRFAMTRLRLYKEAYNFLNKNDGASSMVKQELINTIWNFPFIYPIPVNAMMNSIQKDSVNKFHESNLLKGNMRLEIKNISHLMNLNLMAVNTLKLAKKEEQKTTAGEEVNTEEESSLYDVSAQLTKTLELVIRTKSEQDDLFASKYLGTDLNIPVNNMKYYLCEPEACEMQGTVNTGEFEDIPLNIKGAPFMSMSEVYMLPDWDDEILDNLLNEFTIHGAMMIDLNKITDKVLRLLVPEIDLEEIAAFFKYRDDPADPHYFNSLEDFKKYIVSIANLTTSEKFDEHIAKFRREGLQFGTAPSLFQVISSGTVGRSTYTITAYVSMPVQPERRKLPEGTQPGPGFDGQPNPPPPAPETKPDGSVEDPNKKKQATQLLEPRILEFFIN